MTLEYIPKGQPVFLIGIFISFYSKKDTQGDKFYLILAGKVGIYIRKQSIADVIQAARKKSTLSPPKRRTSLLNKIFDMAEMHTRGLDKVAELGPGI